MSTTPNLNQVHFRVRTDTFSVDAAPTWAAAEDTSVSLAVETNFRIRFCIQNTGTASSTTPFILRVSKNAGAYTAVTTSTGATLGAQSADASTSVDGTSISTNRLTAGAGTWTGAASGYDETGSISTTLPNGNYIELECGLILKTAGAAVGDTFDFRIYNSTTAFTTYTQTPRVTAAVPILVQTHYRFRTDTLSIEGTPTWGAAEDTTYYPGLETTFRLRFAVNNTGGAVSAGGFTLFVSKNSGAYNAVTTSSTDGVQSSASASVGGDEGVLTTKRLTTGTGTAVTGVYDESGTTPAVLAGNSCTEYEFGLILKTANLAASDILDFRIYAGSTAFNTYSLTPRITVPSGPDTEDDLLANDVISTSSVQTGANLQQVHGILANDVASASSVTQPVAVIRRDCLANDVLSASSVSTPAAVITAAPIGLLANDVLSASSVTNPAVKQLQGLLANDVKSNSSVTQPAVKQLHGALANDVLSSSSVGQPAVKSLQGLLANDVISASSVLQPSMGSVGNILANDVKSNSSVSQPNAAITRVCLANDVISASSVSQPAMVQRQNLLANDVISASSVGQPAAVIGRTLLANDVVSPSSVSQPAAGIQRAILANDVTSASFVSNPVVGIVGVIDARDLVSASSVTTPAVHQAQALDAVNVTSASSVTTPAALILRGLLANDATSASSVSQPVAHQAQAFLANDVLSASSVTVPVASEITAGQPLAEDVTSASSVTQPSLVVISGEVLPPELGGAARPYGRVLTRKRWEELLRQLEAERREARQRAERFKGKEDRAKARKAARAASEAIAQAIKGADEAAVADHAAELTRLLEMAKEAKRVEEYMAEMAAVRREAIEMEDENDVEELLLMVA